MPVLADPKIVQTARERPGEVRDLFGAMQEYNNAPGGLAPARDALDKYTMAMEKARALGLAD